MARSMGYSEPARRNAGSSEGARKPVIWTVSVSRLSSLLRDVTPEFDDRAQIETISLGFEEAVRQLRERFLYEDCDVLIAAGSNGAYLKNRIAKPVVLVRPTGFDLMLALTQARRLSPRVGVVTHESEMPVFEDFQKTFGLKIDQRAFFTAEEARNCVVELVSRGCKAIVGTGMVTELAEQAGVTGIMLYSADSIRKAFEAALDFAAMLDTAQSPASRVQFWRRRPGGAGGHKYEARDLQGDSPAMTVLRETVGFYGRSDRTVLITGETGTGKERVANALHASSPRRRGPFVAINCGAIAESLLESELFGYDEGAFTGARRGGRVGLIESASGGSLFLDEIGEMPLLLQTRLLRVLEEREIVRVGSSRPIAVDLRVLAATHGDVEALVADRQFRADLYYRLNVLRIDLLPLRQRRQDIPLLVRTFLQAAGAPGLELEADAMALLLQHDWPGNIRELRNTVERLTVFGRGGNARSISASLLRRVCPEMFNQRLASDASVSVDEISRPRVRGQRPSEIELRRLMDEEGGDRQAVSRRLGVSRTTLWRWLAQ